MATNKKLKCPFCQGQDFENVSLLTRRHPTFWLRPGLGLMGFFNVQKIVTAYRCKGCGFLAQFGEE